MRYGNEGLAIFVIRTQHTVGYGVVCAASSCTVCVRSERRAR